jgi:AcrR family transcriptional regulator
LIDWANLKRKVRALAKSELPTKRALPLGRRQRSKLQKRGRIIKAAKVLFAQRGYESTTTQAVAQAADIGVGTLFCYASSKEDLLVMVFMDELLAATEKATQKARTAKRLCDQVFMVFAGLLSYHYRNLETSRLLLRAVSFVENPERRTDIGHLLGVILASVTHFVSSRKAPASALSGRDLKHLVANCFAIYYNTLNICLNNGESHPKAAALLRERLRVQLLVMER